MGGSGAPPRLAARRALGATPTRHPPGIEVEDEAAVWREFDFVAELLADGREHLCGERFGAADLTFAALSASVVVPPVYGVPLPSPTSCLPTPPRSSNAPVSTRPGVTRSTLFAKCRRETVA